MIPENIIEAIHTHGDPHYVALFLKRAIYIEETQCLEFTTKAQPSGYSYANFTVAKGVRVMFHQAALYFATGQRSTREMQASHKCGNRRCGNPDHLVLESVSENAARKAKPTWSNQAKVKYPLCPVKMAAFPFASKKEASRLVSKLRESAEGCWVFDGNNLRTGYGQIGVKGKKEMAHRAAYRWSKGEIGDGLVIDHQCRNRACCNPAHLRAVTQAVNCQRKLTDEDVREIRRRLATGEETHRQIADYFGVYRTMISHIKSGRRWKHLNGA